ncbi:MAG TPA: saccharopine dehydrogenase C-terminal domain-containing protein [Mycobacteriales bacterium]|nr:saccharopine dehydrogenase C-terminal domain-containing protein [Mycobacteriales bacterium]
MTEPAMSVPPTGRVHWVGTGMSTGSGLGLVCAGAETVLWGRTEDKARNRLATLGLAGRAATRAFTADALAAKLAEGDLVVSMLPPAEHPDLLRLAIGRDAHFACSSYLSPGIAGQAGAAAARGLVVLTEIGLDPGIDHLLAHRLVRAARQAAGDEPATVRFTSYCGSNPAVPNDFRYRFSWAPRGVLTALLTPARGIQGGQVVAVDRAWEAVRPVTVAGEPFEVYPNRDSIPYVEAYGMPETWTLETFTRGTMRLDGWSTAWQGLFGELAGADDQRLTELAAGLAERYPTSASDRDRVVMSVKLEIRWSGDRSWTGEYVLDAEGTDAEAATPRLVSVPLACGILEIVAGRVAPGLHRAAADPESVERWLARLAEQGIVAEYHGDPIP